MTRLEPQPPGITLPQPGPVSAPYWEGCAAGELRYVRCTSCDTVVMNPSTVCHACLGRDLMWQVSSGRGSLYSWTVVWRPPTPAFQVPYAPAIVELDEGFHLITAIIGCEPDELADGLRVEMELHDAGEGIALPYFRPSA